MTSNDAWRRFLEMGATVGELTIARAEDIARGLTAENEQVRERAWREVDQLTRFGVRMGEQLLDVAKDRLATKLRTRSGDTLDRVLERLGDLLSAGATDEPSRAADDPVTAVATERPAPDRDVVHHEALDDAVSGPADEPPPRAKPPKRPKAPKGEHDGARVAAPTTSSGADKQRSAKKTTDKKVKTHKQHQKNAKEKQPADTGPAPLRVLAVGPDPGAGALP